MTDDTAESAESTANLENTDDEHAEAEDDGGGYTQLPVEIPTTLYERIGLETETGSVDEVADWMQASARLRLLACDEKRHQTVGVEVEVPDDILARATLDAERRTGDSDRLGDALTEFFTITPVYTHDSNTENDADENN